MTGSENAVREEIISFADRHLYPYRIRNTAHGEELTPEYCPFCQGGDHGDKNTFSVSLESGVYLCLRGSCHARGSFPRLAERFGEESRKSFAGVTRRDEPQEYRLPDTQLYPPTEEIFRYFESRKINRETVTASHIQANGDGMIVFPCYMGGVDVFEKYRRPWKPKPTEKGKEWASPGCKPILFGMDDCSFSQPLIITEGQLDCLSLRQAGYPNAVSVPMGCENTAWIDHCFEWLEKFTTIILFGDSDEPGRKMVREVAKRLDEARCLIVDGYPTRPDSHILCKDANEILYFYGELKLVEMVESARATPISGVIDLADVEPIDPTSVEAVKTNIPDLDKALGGFGVSQVIVLSGRSGEGKSTLSGLILLNAIEQQWKCCAYSGELSKEKFQEWINLQAAGSEYITLKHSNTRGCDVPVVPYEVSRRIRDWYRGKFYVYDNDGFSEESEHARILRLFTASARRYGCRVFLVDNLMSSLADEEEEFRAQARFVNDLKKFAKRFGAVVMVVSHPRKTKKGESIEKADVSGASAIVNLADSVIVAEKPDLRIIKNRDGGIEKLITCAYCPDSRRIYQADKGDLNRFSWDKTGLTPPAKLACQSPDYQVYIKPTVPF